VVVVVLLFVVCAFLEVVLGGSVVIFNNREISPTQDVRNSVMAFFWPVWELYWELCWELYRKLKTPSVGVGVGPRANYSIFKVGHPLLALGARGLVEARQLKPVFIGLYGPPFLVLNQ
jgi:hypothetical protein